MSLFTYFPINPGFMCPRSYVAGISIVHPNITTPVWAGRVLQFSDNIGQDYHIAFKNEFYTASSNTYSIPYTFDAALTHVYIGGVEQVAGAFIYYALRPPRVNWYVEVVLSFFASPERISLLPPMPPTYWMPITDQ